MTRLNCPNCGAPIDIHRKDCEYCGTPYDLKDREVLYADNQPFYIYQDPIEWNDDTLDRFNETIKRGIERTSFDICNTEAKLKHLEAQLQAKNLEAWQHELTRQCVNAYPKVNYGSLIEGSKVKVIKNDLPLFGRILICFGIPGLVIITLFILGAFHII